MSIYYVYGPCDGDGLEIGKRLVSFASGTKNKRQPLERKLYPKALKKLSRWLVSQPERKNCSGDVEYYPLVHDDWDEAKVLPSSFPRGDDFDFVFFTLFLKQV
jgi:hypothetical protein